MVNRGRLKKGRCIDVDGDTEYLHRNKSAEEGGNVRECGREEMRELEEIKSFNLSRA